MALGAVPSSAAVEVPKAMGDANVGIDISADQTSVPAGPWLFVVHKATEGHDYQDPTFASRYPSLGVLAPLRGAYHYARPADGFPGDKQAEFFAVTCLAAGFKPGVDMWQLDCEGTGNETVDAGTWDAFVTAFMARATELLGVRSFLYVGEFFMPEVFRLLVQHYNWWLPDYGPNDGNVHPFAEGLPAVPMIHQYSSAGGLDRNCINNAEAWAFMFTHVAPKPAPLPKPQPPNPIVAILKRVAQLVALIRAKSLHKGDRGPSVLLVQQLLRKHGYDFVAETSVYDNNTELAVALFKRSIRLSNLDGTVCGRACIDALMR